MPDRDRVSYRALARSGLIALALIAGLILIVGSESGLIPWLVQICPENPYGSGNCQAATYNVVYAAFIETANFLNNEYGVIAALAGAAVAWYTYTLRNSTDRLWQSADDALKATERAFVFIEGFNSEITTAADSGAITGFGEIPANYRDRPGLYLTRFAVQPRWKNSGTTSVRNMKIRVDWGYSPRWNSHWMRNFDIGIVTQVLFSSHHRLSREAGLLRYCALANSLTSEPLELAGKSKFSSGDGLITRMFLEAHIPSNGNTSLDLTCTTERGSARTSFRWATIIELLITKKAATAARTRTARS